MVHVNLCWLIRKPENALMVSQQLLQHVSLIPTPLGKITSYNIDNKMRRNKSLLTIGLAGEFVTTWIVFTSSLSERRVAISNVGQTVEQRA